MIEILLMRTVARQANLREVLQNQGYTLAPRQPCWASVGDMEQAAIPCVFKGFKQHKDSDVLIGLDVCDTRSPRSKPPVIIVPM